MKQSLGVFACILGFIVLMSWLTRDIKIGGAPCGAWTRGLGHWQLVLYCPADAERSLIGAQVQAGIMYGYERITVVMRDK